MVGLLVNNWKGCGRKWSCPDLKQQPGIYLEELKKTMEESRESVSQPRFKAGTSLTQSRSVAALGT
jgi:hypothetical protein